MTNPLTEPELAACRVQFERDHLVNSINCQRFADVARNYVDARVQHEWIMYEMGFSAAIDYLRAEQAKEEPDAYMVPGDGLAGTRTILWAAGEDWTGGVYRDEAKKLYLRPSEPSQSTPSAESAPQIASPEGWHAPGMGEVHNEQHTKMIFCCDGEDVASDSLANEVCSALLRLSATPPSESATIPEARFELTRSIIYKCPALKLPQEFLLRLGGVAQIVVLKGADDNTAEFILSACNAAMSREATGGKHADACC